MANNWYTDLNKIQSITGLVGISDGTFPICKFSSNYCRILKITCQDQSFFNPTASCDVVFKYGNENSADLVSINSTPVTVSNAGYQSTVEIPLDNISITPNSSVHITIANSPEASGYVCYCIEYVDLGAYQIADIPVIIPNPIAPIDVSGNSAEFTAGQIYFIKYRPNVTATVTGFKIFPQNLTSESVFKFGIYTYHETAEVSKIRSSSLTINSIGGKTVYFDSPITFIRGVDISFAILMISGGCTFTAGGIYDESLSLAWTGSTELTDLPLSDDVRDITTNPCPSIEWIVP